MSTEHPFEPDWTLSPGSMLRRILDDRDITEAGFAATARLGPETLAGVLAATVRIDGVIAARIGSALGTSAQMWLNAEENYRADLARGAKDSSDETREDGHA